nr:hypothetical protein [Rhodococcus sp. 15-2388-1-1a]
MTSRLVVSIDLGRLNQVSPGFGRELLGGQRISRDGLLDCAACDAEPSRHLSDG